MDITSITFVVIPMFYIQLPSIDCRILDVDKRAAFNTQQKNIPSCNFSEWKTSELEEEDLYYKQMVEKENCPSAARICEQFNGRLVKVEHSGIEEFLSFQILKPCDPSRYWIGLNNLNTNTFHWSDGTELEAEANQQEMFFNPTGRDKKSCMTANFSTNFKDWKMKEPSELHPYLCESEDPCSSRPTITVNDGEKIEGSGFVTLTKPAEVKCFLGGLSEYVLRISMACDDDFKSATADQGFFVSLVIYPSVLTRTCRCWPTLSIGDEKVATLNITFTVDPGVDLERSSEMLLDIVHNVTKMDKHMFMDWLAAKHLLLQLNDLTSRIQHAKTYKFGENILKIISIITECCSTLYESELNLELRTQTERVAALIPLHDGGPFEFKSTQLAAFVATASGYKGNVSFCGEVSLQNNNIEIHLVDEVSDVKTVSCSSLSLSFDAIRKYLAETTNSTFIDRISVAYYRDAKFFGNKFSGKHWEIVGRVIDVDLPGVVVNGVDDVIVLNYRYPESMTSPKCVYWKPAGDDVNFRRDGFGNWESDGCKVVEIYNDIVTCSCNHLTSFALMMVRDDLKKHEIPLAVLSIVGCTVSSISLLVTLVTYWMFPFLRLDKPSKILMRLCATLLMANIVFIVNALVVHLVVEEGVTSLVCKFAAMLLHYFMLSSLLWMSCDAFYLYKAMVKVFINMRYRYLLKFTLISWGVPFLVVLLTAATNSFQNYDLINKSICWITSPTIYYAFVMPAAFLMLFNFTIFGIVIQVIQKASSSELVTERREMIVKQLKGAMSIASLFGLAWIFGFLANGFGHVVFSYLFVIFNTLQGFFIFVFYCVLKPNVKYFWTKWCWDWRKPEVEPSTNEYVTVRETGNHSRRSTAESITILFKKKSSSTQI